MAATFLGSAALTRERLIVLARTVVQMKKALDEGRDWDAYVLLSSIPNDPDHMEERLYLSNQFDAKERFVLKTYEEAERVGRGQDLP